MPPPHVTYWLMWLTGLPQEWTPFSEASLASGLKELALLMCKKATYLGAILGCLLMLSISHFYLSFPIGIRPITDMESTTTLIR